MRSFQTEALEAGLFTKAILGTSWGMTGGIVGAMLGYNGTRESLGKAAIYGLLGIGTGSLMDHASPTRAGVVGGAATGYAMGGPWGAAAGASLGGEIGMAGDRDSPHSSFAGIGSSIAGAAIGGLAAGKTGAVVGASAGALGSILGYSTPRNAPIVGLGAGAAFAGFGLLHGIIPELTNPIWEMRHHIPTLPAMLKGKVSKGLVKATGNAAAGGIAGKLMGLTALGIAGGAIAGMEAYKHEEGNGESASLYMPMGIATTEVVGGIALASAATKVFSKLPRKIHGKKLLDFMIDHPNQGTLGMLGLGLAVAAPLVAAAGAAMNMAHPRNSYGGGGYDRMNSDGIAQAAYHKHR